MCWNAPVSFGSFVIILWVSFLLFQRNGPNDVLCGSFILSYGFMQLLEGILWLSQNRQSKSAVFRNHVASIMACLLLYLHVLAIVVGIYYDRQYKKTLSVNTKRVLIGVGILVLLFGIYRIVTEQSNSKYPFLCYPLPSNGRHLVWGFPNDYMTIILPVATIIAILYIRPWKILMFFLVYYYGTLLVSFVVSGQQSIGSYWCWLVAILSFLVYLFNN